VDKSIIRIKKGEDRRRESKDWWTLSEDNFNASVYVSWQTDNKLLTEPRPPPQKKI
jgi:hypothetical protein